MGRGADVSTIDYVCPRCHGALSADASSYRCDTCAIEYPIILGIPDFRVEPDPWIGLEEDRAKSKRLVEVTEGLELARSVEAYWAMTPGTPVEHARRFTDYVLAGERRAAEWLETLDKPANGPWLEIGCASGDLLAVCAQRGTHAVGVDVALRWLVLARKRAALAQGAQVLVCANGEFLPFRDGTFARVVSVGTLEHCRSAETVLAESSRVMQRGGDTKIRTTNRYTLLPEPHVNLWGVGFVPRRWADAYVRWRGGQGYTHFRSLSAQGLRKALHTAGFSDIRVEAATLLASDRERLAGASQAAVPLYERLRSMPLVSRLLALIAPLLEASARRHTPPDRARTR